MGDGGEVLDFVEKSRNPKSNLVSMGICVFNEDVLSQQGSAQKILAEKG